MTSIGQKTGMLRASKQVQNIATINAFDTEYQNLNSGSLRIKGLNFSLFFVGNDGPSSASVSLNPDGSIFGVRKAMNKLSKYIPKAYVTIYQP